MVKVSYRCIEWELEFDFNLAHGSRKNTEALIIEMKLGNSIGCGEVVFPPYLIYNRNQAIMELDSIMINEDVFENFDSIRQEINRIKLLLCTNFALIAGIEMAIINLFVDLKQESIYNLFCLPINSSIPTSFTISYSEESILNKKIEKARNFSVLKLKFGTGNDEKFFRYVRSKTSVPVAIDANQGWSSLDEAHYHLEYLRDNGVLYIEQPFNKDNLEIHKLFKENCSIPLIADESFQVYEDLEKLVQSFDGVNIKLLKCGGLLEALKIVNKCDELNMLKMLGCMTSSSIAISYANFLSSKMDFIDLDGAFLIENDPNIDKLDLSDGILFNK